MSATTRAAMEKYKEYNGTNNFYTAPLIETTIQHKDGTTREAESSATYLHDVIRGHHAKRHSPQDAAPGGDVSERCR